MYSFTFTSDELFGSCREAQGINADAACKATEVIEDSFSRVFYLWYTINCMLHTTRVDNPTFNTLDQLCDIIESLPREVARTYAEYITLDDDSAALILTARGEDIRAHLVMKADSNRASLHFTVEPADSQRFVKVTFMMIRIWTALDSCVRGSSNYRQFCRTLHGVRVID